MQLVAIRPGCYIAGNSAIINLNYSKILNNDRRAIKMIIKASVLFGALGFSQYTMHSMQAEEAQRFYNRRDKNGDTIGITTLRHSRDNISEALLNLVQEKRQFLMHAPLLLPPSAPSITRYGACRSKSCNAKPQLDAALYTEQQNNKKHN